MPPPCPSDYQLEALALDLPSPSLREHVDGCAHCQERWRAMEEHRAEFLRAVVPAFRQRLEQRRWRWPRWATLMPMLAAATTAGLAFALLPSRTSMGMKPPEYLGAKGGLGLAVYVNAEDQAQKLADAARVPAAAALRFSVQPSGTCRLFIISVDGHGTVSRLYPPQGDGADISGPGALPGGALLDGRPGPERIFAVCGSSLLTFKDLERSARATVSAGDQAVRQAEALSGLGHTAQASLLLEKVP